MRLPRVRFTVRRMMLAVAIASVYLTALHSETLSPFASVVFASLPILRTSIRAGWRESSGDSMSGVGWTANPTSIALISISLGLAIMCVAG